MALKPGDKAPNFRLEADSGDSLSLAMFKGHPLVLFFYPKDDTSGCTREAIDFSENRRKFEALSVNILGVSRDSLESHEKFKTKHRLKIALGSDPETKMAKDYGVWVEKSMYGRKYMGLERSTFLIDAKSVIREIWRKVKVPGHVEAVLAVTKSL